MPNYPGGGNINAQTNTSANWFYPFLPQGILGITVTSGISTISGIAQTGWASFNQAGFTFQNGQYNSRREGFGA